MKAFVLIIVATSFVIGCNKGPQEPVRQATPKKKVEQKDVAPYKVTERKDVSYGAVKRMCYYVVFDGQKMPSENKMLSTAKKLWSKNKDWNEFTVFMVGGPAQNFDNGAFAIAEFDKEGMKDWQINEYVLELAQM